jgi:hypothetical protein
MRRCRREAQWQYLVRSILTGAKRMAPFLYRQYQQAFRLVTFDSRFMKYGWCKLPQLLDGMWMPYSQMIVEFSQEIANAILINSRDICSVPRRGTSCRPR